MSDHQEQNKERTGPGRWYPEGSPIVDSRDDQRCDFVASGRRCGLPKGHAGSHLFPIRESHHSDSDAASLPSAKEDVSHGTDALLCAVQAHHAQEIEQEIARVRAEVIHQAATVMTFNKEEAERWKARAESAEQGEKAAFDAGFEAGVHHVLAPGEAWALYRSLGNNILD